MTTPLLEKMLSHLFDYAGAFPPASLPLDDALRTSLSFPNTLHRPHLVAADLVVNLQSARTLLERHEHTLRSWPGAPITVCLLGEAVESQKDLTSEPRNAERTFLMRTPADLVRVSSLEVRFGAEVCGDPALLADCLASLEDNFSQPEWLLCVEPALTGNGDEARLLRVCDALAGRRFALKVRGGGGMPIPTNLLATIIDAVSQRKLLLKATAGMHHPLLEPQRYGNQHGFLNVLAALTLRRNLPEFRIQSIRECLGNRDGSAFIFNHGLRWKDFLVPADAVVDTLAHFPLRIGSCSLHEPDEDLQRLYPVAGPLTSR
jgi:hypothetical protein